MHAALLKLAPQWRTARGVARGQRLALAAAVSSARLGAASPLRLLPIDLAELIAEDYLVMPAPAATRRWHSQRKQSLARAHSRQSLLLVLPAVGAALLSGGLSRLGPGPGPGPGPGAGAAAASVPGMLLSALTAALVVAAGTALAMWCVRASVRHAVLSTAEWPCMVK
jgi:hypothetical protein